LGRGRGLIVTNGEGCTVRRLEINQTRSGRRLLPPWSRFLAAFGGRWGPTSPTTARIPASRCPLLSMVAIPCAAAFVSAISRPPTAALAPVDVPGGTAVYHAAATVGTLSPTAGETHHASLDDWRFGRDYRRPCQRPCRNARQGVPADRSRHSGAEFSTPRAGSIIQPRGGCAACTESGSRCRSSHPYSRRTRTPVSAPAPAVSKKARSAPVAAARAKPRIRIAQRDDDDDDDDRS
jgi:hypothetical protein